MKFVAIVCFFLSVPAFAKDSSTSKDEVRKPSSVQLGDNKKELGELLSEALAAYVKKSGKYAGVGQGWGEYYIGVRCAIPEGTGNPSDKPTCNFVDIK